MHPPIRIDSYNKQGWSENQKVLEFTVTEDTVEIQIRDAIKRATDAVICINCTELGETLIIIGTTESDPVNFLLGQESEP